MPTPTTTKRTNRANGQGRAERDPISHGIIGHNRLKTDAERDYATVIGFGRHASELVTLIDSIGSAKATIEKDRDLSPSGRERRRLAVGSEALAGVMKTSRTIVARATRDIAAALEAERTTGADPIQLGEVVAVEAGGRIEQLEGFAGRDINARLDLIRRELLKAEPSELPTIIRTAAENGDALTIAALDTMPEWMRSSMLDRAAIDADAWVRHRHTYRIARNPEGAGRIAAMATVAERVSMNAFAGRGAIERAGLTTDRDSTRSFEQFLEPLQAAIQRARS